MNSEIFIKSVEKGKYPINKKLLDSLYLEQEDLLKKMAKHRDKGDIGTYKNLVRSLTDVTALIDNMWRNIPIKPREVWKEKFEYTKSSGKELISTWEQKGEDIRNKKVYEVKEIKEVTKDNKILTKQYGETTAMINKTTPMIVYYEKDKDLDVKKFLLNIKAIDYTHYHEFECLYNNTLPNGYSTTDEQSKELLLQINDSQFKVIGGELKDFDVSEYINEGVNTINIFSYTQYRVTTSYTCEGYMNI